MKKMLVLVLLALIVSGCAANRHHKLYEGDPALRAQIQSFDTVLIKYIDDEDMGMSFIGQKQTYDIKAGQHTLLVEYSDLFQVDADQHEKIVSRPAKVTFIAEPGKQYQLQHAPQKRLDNARAFAEKPEFWVVELGSGDRVAAEVELSRPRSFLQGLKVQSAPEYVFVSDAATPAAAQAVPAVDQSGTASQPHLEMLKFSWQNASASERQAFLEWIQQ